MRLLNCFAWGSFLFLFFFFTGMGSHEKHIPYKRCNSCLFFLSLNWCFIPYIFLLLLSSPLRHIIIQPSRDTRYNKAVRSQSRQINHPFLLWSQWRGWRFAAGPFHWTVSRKCLDGILYIKSRTGKWAYSGRHAVPRARACRNHMHRQK